MIFVAAASFDAEERTSKGTRGSKLIGSQCGGSDKVTMKNTLQVWSSAANDSNFDQ